VKKRIPCCFVLAALCACAHAPTRGRNLDPVALAARIEKAHAVPDSLTAAGKAFVDAPRNGGRYPFQVSVKRPASLRIAALDPLGNPAAVLVADAGQFALLDLRQQKYFRGPATAENLSRLIPAPLRAEELVALLLGGAPPLPGGVPVAAFANGDGSVLVLEAPGGLSQEVSAGSDLRIDGVRRLRGKDLWWSATLEDHDDAGGAQMPRLLRFSIPSDKTEVELTLRDRLIGKPPPFGAFQLGAPPGVEVVELH
jgi:hypothetical protein